MRAPSAEILLFLSLPLAKRSSELREFTFPTRNFVEGKLAEFAEQPRNFAKSSIIKAYVDRSKGNTFAFDAR